MTLYHKPFQGCRHGDLYTYELLSSEAKRVNWRRSDGLEGSCKQDEWDRLYVPVPVKNKPAVKKKPEPKPPRAKVVLTPRALKKTQKALAPTTKRKR